MEEIKMNVRNKQLDGSTEVSEVTFTDDNEIESENSVEPGPNPTTGGFIDTLTEDNLLCELRIEDNQLVEVNEDGTESLPNNSLIAITLSFYNEEEEGYRDTCYSVALGCLENYGVNEYGMVTFNLFTNINGEFTSESGDAYLTINRIALDDMDGDYTWFILGGSDKSKISNGFSLNGNQVIKIYKLK